MADNSIFHRFCAHDEIEIISVDHVLDMLTFHSKLHGRGTLPMRCGNISKSTLQEGRLIEIQYGSLSAVDVDSDRARQARLRKGGQKISGMRHLAPSITPLSLSVMRWSLGDAVCSAELRKYAQRAATTQTQTSYLAKDAKTNISLYLGSGCITPNEITLTAKARLTVQGIHLHENIPQTLLSAMAGREISEIISHPAITAGTILQASQTETGAYIHLSPETLGIDEALDAISRQPALAA